MDTQAASLLLDVALIAVLVLVGVRLYRRRRAAAAPTPAAGPERIRTISSREEAEGAAAEHLSGLGFTDAGPATGRAEGVDVAGRAVDAQVRWHAKPADVTAVERLVAGAIAPNSVLYSFAGIRRSAMRRADEERVAVFRLQVDRSATPLNDAARALVDAG